MKGFPSTNHWVSFGVRYLGISGVAVKRVAPKNLPCLIEHLMNISLWHAWFLQESREFGITQFSIPERHPFLLASWCTAFCWTDLPCMWWCIQALMKHTRKKGPAVYLFRQPKWATFLPVHQNNSWKGVVLCWLQAVFLKSITSEFSLWRCISFCMLFFEYFSLPKLIGLNWQSWSKSFESGLTKSSTPLVTNALSARARGKKNNITLYFTSADLKGNLNILVNHLNFPASFIRHASKLGSYTFNNSHETNTSRAIHPLRWAVSNGQKKLRWGQCTIKTVGNFLHFCVTLHIYRGDIFWDITWT